MEGEAGRNREFTRDAVVSLILLREPQVVEVTKVITTIHDYETEQLLCNFNNSK